MVGGARFRFAWIDFQPELVVGNRTRHCWDQKVYFAASKWPCTLEVFEIKAGQVQVACSCDPKLVVYHVLTWVGWICFVGPCNYENYENVSLATWCCNRHLEINHNHNTEIYTPVDGEWS